MDECDARGHPLIVEFGVVRGELTGREHALVGDRRRRQRREVDAGMVGPLAHDVGPSAQIVGIPGRVAGVDAEEDVAHVRLGRPCDVAEDGFVAGDVADREDGEPLLGGDAAHERLFVGERLMTGGREVRVALDQRSAGEVAAVVLGEEADAHGVLSRLREGDAVGGEHLGEVVVRDLQRDACSVAGAFVGGDASAVFELAQRAQGLFDDEVVGLPAVPDDEGEPAGVVLERGIVESGAVLRELGGR
ncbi:Uncharacterised protein [Mycobacteroides abscessus subsp. abscessus]|nr:Uncharacterised protein [Mycobacteroides abscessus subsp. abscessus]